MEKKKSYNLTWFCCGAVLFAASFLLLYLARRVEGLAQWYATHIYPVIVGTVGRTFGIVPLSVAEILLYVIILLVLVLFVRLLVRLMRKKGGREYAAHYLSGLWLTASVLFLLYTLNCGINYQRLSFSECEGMTTGSYSAEELREVCELLTQDVNAYAAQVERDEDGRMMLDGRERKAAVEAMKSLGDTYEELAGYYPKPKALTGSRLLSVQSLSGIYAPFTVEANYNKDMTDYNIPFTACHELSHLRGFMQEEEANFIAYLACMESDSEIFRYSGSMLGWIKCMNVLYKEDLDAWKEVREKLSEDVLPDLQANSRFWASYDGAVAEVSEKINDNYLKANGQPDGVKSYDRMVDLLVAYYGKK
ncbi:MAG: DUF3810 domain-containing protein [Eubacteriales bacterium]|nr:DUF3810 domain-containing protein [Eubacteriales bacterium]